MPEMRMNVTDEKEHEAAAKFADSMMTGIDAAVEGGASLHTLMQVAGGALGVTFASRVPCTCGQCSNAALFTLLGAFGAAKAATEKEMVERGLPTPNDIAMGQAMAEQGKTN